MTLETKFKVKNVILVEFNVSADMCDLPGPFLFCLLLRRVSMCQYIED